MSDDDQISQRGNSSKIAFPFKGEDLDFLSQRLDGSELQGADYKHTVFERISFKEAQLKNCTFLNCTFINCYFRKTTFSNCSFVGCRFIECYFPRVSVRSCDFRYANFRSCQIDFSEMEHSLPSEPNIREELARNLSVESRSLGLGRQAGEYRSAEIRARERHLRSAVSSKSTWYQEHYGGLARVGAFFQLSASVLNRWCWGYGERTSVLVRNVIVLAVLIFPGLYYWNSAGMTTSQGREPNLTEIVQFSLLNFIPATVSQSVSPTTTTTRFIAGFEALLGVIAWALFASYVLRWSLRK